MLTQINLASLSNDPFYQIFDNKKGTRWLLVSPKFIKYLSNGWDSSSFGLCPLPFVPKQEFGKRDFCLLDLRYSSGPMFTLLSVNYSLTFTVI
jgi:hypothetical protein